MSFPVTISDRCCYMLEQHGMTKQNKTTYGYHVYNNSVAPKLGKFLYVGPKGSLRVGDTINKSIPSPVLRSRLLNEYTALLKKSHLQQK